MTRRESRPITRLVSLGNVIVDIVADVPALPPRGGDVFASGSYLAAGGGFNLMAAAARQGLETVYGGVLGTGPFGTVASTALRDAGIRHVLEPLGALDTGFDVAMVEASGERTFVTVPGAEAHLSTALLDRVAILPTDAVAVSGYSMLHPVNRGAILERLDRLPDETTVFYDPGPLGAELPPDVIARLAARVDWLSCNDREAALLTGIADPDRAAGALAAGLRRGSAIVRLGGDGCLVADADIITRVPGFAVVAVDTNGAGDAHVGAFIAALAAGSPATDAAARANAVGAISVTRRGPASSPTRDETDAFLAQR